MMTLDHANHKTRRPHHHRINLVSLAALFLAAIGVAFAIVAVSVANASPLVVLPPAIVGVVAILRLRI